MGTSIKRGYRMGRKKYSKELKTQIAIDATKGHNSTTYVLATAF